MKTTLLLLILISLPAATRAQLTVTVDSFTGDSTVSTAFDTLSIEKIEGKEVVTAKVVGVKSISKKKSTYWLFFYFLSTEAANIRISNSNYAYFKTINNQFFRIPYKGKPQSYSEKDNAGFFVDVTNYTRALSHVEITDVRLETSHLYEQITLKQPYRRKISDLVGMLLAY